MSELNAFLKVAAQPSTRKRLLGLNPEALPTHQQPVSEAAWSRATNPNNPQVASRPLVTAAEPGKAAPTSQQQAAAKAARREQHEARVAKNKADAQAARPPAKGEIPLNPKAGAAAVQAEVAKKTAPAAIHTFAAPPKAVGAHQVLPSSTVYSPNGPLAPKSLEMAMRVNQGEFTRTPGMPASAPAAAKPQPPPLPRKTPPTAPAAAAPAAGAGSALSPQQLASFESRQPRAMKYTLQGRQGPGRAAREMVAADPSKANLALLYGHGPGHVYLNGGAKVQVGGIPAGGPSTPVAPAAPAPQAAAATGANNARAAYGIDPGVRPPAPSGPANVRMPEVVPAAPEPRPVPAALQAPSPTQQRPALGATGTSISTGGAAAGTLPAARAERDAAARRGMPMGGAPAAKTPLAEVPAQNLAAKVMSDPAVAASVGTQVPPSVVGGVPVLSRSLLNDIAAHKAQQAGAAAGPAAPLPTTPTPAGNLPNAQAVTQQLAAQGAVPGAEATMAEALRGKPLAANQLGEARPPNPAAAINPSAQPERPGQAPAAPVEFPGQAAAAPATTAPADATGSTLSPQADVAQVQAQTQAAAPAQKFDPATAQFGSMQAPARPEGAAQAPKDPNVSPHKAGSPEDIVFKASRGQLPGHQVPAHLEGQVQAEKFNLQRQSLIESRDASLKDMHRQVSTPERREMLTQIQQMPDNITRPDGSTVPNQAKAEAMKQYDALPHSPEHVQTMADHEAQLNQQMQQALYEQQQAGQQVMKDRAPGPDYDSGRAMATGQFAAQNPWLQNAALYGGLAGAGLGAITSDEQNGTLPWYQRALVGGALGAGAGAGVLHGLPHAVGMHRGQPLPMEAPVRS